MAAVPRNRICLYVALTVGLLVLDLWSKDVAFGTFGVRNGGPWLADNSVFRFRFFTSLNEGALWGMGQGFAWLFAALSIGAFGAILWFLFVKKYADSLWLTTALGFVSGGTLGNLYDRLGMHGIILPGSDTPVSAVRDFFHFQFGGTPDAPAFDWAIFNVADICLVTGAIMLMLHSFQQPAGAEAAADAPAEKSVPAVTRSAEATAGR
ncbi:MAG: signal peptidase II [Planctomycetaceae bacterium]|nr:signal peptidase II [Planctomycetaceae bacterium]